MGRTGGRSPVPQILPACKTFHLNSNPAVLLGPGRAAPDAKVGPSPCPRQSGREGSAALSLNLNRALWPRPDRRLETRRSEAAGMVNADPEPTEQTSRSPPSSPRKSEPSLRRLPPHRQSPATPRKVFCPNQRLPSLFSASLDQPDVPERRFRGALCLRQSRSLRQSRGARKGGGCAKQGPPARGGRVRPLHPGLGQEARSENPGGSSRSLIQHSLAF